MILIGIDPGKTTGYAQWHIGEKRFVGICSMSIHVALATVEKHHKAASNAGCPRSMLVIFEDARMRQWFGNAGREVLQGVGSVKRDCTIWEDFLTDLGIPYQAHRPAAHATKWTPDYFKRATGWQPRTSEHGRDAAVLVWNINEPIAQGMLRTWEQGRTRAKSSAHT